MTKPDYINMTQKPDYINMSEKDAVTQPDVSQNDVSTYNTACVIIISDDVIVCRTLMIKCTAIKRLY